MSKDVGNLFNLEGEIAVITGAAGKLGSYYSKLLMDSKAKVIMVDSNKESLEELHSSFELSYKENSLPISCDITDKNEVQKAFKTILRSFGEVSILINNAAAHQVSFVEGNLIEFEEFPLEVWQENLNVNLTGAFLCCQEAGKHMISKNKGCILNIGSTYGVVACDQRIYGDSGLNSNVAYAATKSGLINFTRYLASYWQGKNIRVNCLSPGGVYNNQPDDFYENYTYRTMLKRMGKKEDLGNAVLYLVSDASDWVTGINHVVDGGFTAW